MVGFKSLSYLKSIEFIVNVSLDEKHKKMCSLIKLLEIYLLTFSLKFCKPFLKELFILHDHFLFPK